MKFAHIDADKSQWPVEVQCDALGVSRSGYYAWKECPDAPRLKEDAALVEEIKAAYETGRGAYGRAAKILGLSWGEVHQVMEKAVRRGRARKPKAVPHRLGVDEKATGM